MARAVAIGLFAGLMPGPTQMLTGGVMALLLRANLPLTLFVTLYTNPLTIVPLYLLAYRYGAWLLGTDTQANISMAPDFSLATFGSWLAQMVDWAVSLGPALLVGLPALGLSAFWRVRPTLPSLPLSWRWSCLACIWQITRH